MSDAEKRIVGTLKTKERLRVAALYLKNTERLRHSSPVFAWVHDYIDESLHHTIVDLRELKPSQ
jgi:hypothetical protein